MSSEARTMNVKYAGTCVGCGASIDKGVRAHYLPDEKVVRCMDCGPGSPAIGIAAAGASAAQEAKHQDDARDAAAARAAAFAAGAKGERMVASALASLTALGYSVVHDRAAGGRANLDHLVVGPSGVWIVNAKHWSGPIEIADGKLKQKGRSRHRQVERAASERELVQRALERGGLEAPVRSMFAFTGDAPMTTGEVDSVLVVAVAELAGEIEKGETVLDAPTVDRVTSTLTAAFPPASAAAQGPYVEESELPDDLRDSERYYHVTFWSAGDRSRLYTHRAGSTLGYIDLMAREIEVTSDRDSARDNLQFIEYWFAPYETPSDRRGAMERTFLRFVGLDNRTVVGLRRNGRGFDFLDVYLIDIEGRRQLGTVDLLSSIVDTEDHDMEAVVAKSGAIFQQRDRS